MYLRHFGLKREPFHITPDPRFFYLSPTHKEAFGALIYGIRNRKGFLAVIGEVGLGKTTVLRTFLQHRGSKHNIKTVFIFNPNVTFKGLLHIIYDELGLERPHFGNDAASSGTPQMQTEADELFHLVHTLHMAIVQDYTEGSTVVLVIDEAQNMPVQTLEHLRMLSNLETATDKLLQIILIGQPELERTLNLPELRQLRHRIAIRCILRPLNRRQTKKYIQHRLVKAGLEKGSLFTKRALRFIYRKSQGTPRSINILCDNALITAYGYGKDKVTTRIVREVNKDLSGKSFRSNRTQIKYALPLFMGALALGLWFSKPYLPSSWTQWTQNLTTFASIAPQKSSTETASRPVKKAEPPKTVGQKIEQDAFLHPRPSKKDPAKLPDVSADLELGMQIHSSTTPLSGLYLTRQDTVADFSGNEGEIPQKGGQKINGSQGNDQNSVHNPDSLYPPMDEQEAHLAIELADRFSFFTRLSHVRQRVLVEMAQQTSLQGFISFENMMKALHRQDFAEAARQMQHSHWRSRVGQAAAGLCQVMASGREQDMREWLETYEQPN